MIFFPENKIFMWSALGTSHCEDTLSRWPWYYLDAFISIFNIADNMEILFYIVGKSARI